MAGSDNPLPVDHVDSPLLGHQRFQGTGQGGPPRSVAASAPEPASGLPVLDVPSRPSEERYGSIVGRWPRCWWDVLRRRARSRLEPLKNPSTAPTLKSFGGQLGTWPRRWLTSRRTPASDLVLGSLPEICGSRSIGSSVTAVSFGISHGVFPSSRKAFAGTARTMRRGDTSSMTSVMRSRH